MASTEYIQIAPFTRLLTHFRFLLTVQSEQGRSHSLILFRLSEPATPDSPNARPGQLYAMESTCPHLGADLSHAEIEECETGVVAVCPWHRYDFDLRTGKSETGLKACTYNIEVRTDPSDGVDNVWVEAPEGGKSWRVVELRPVSEEFADPPPRPLVKPESEAASVTEGEPIIPTENAPTTLMQWAVLILNTPNPTLKPSLFTTHSPALTPGTFPPQVERTKHAVNLFHTGQLATIGNTPPHNPPQPPTIPARDDAYTQNTVDPRKLTKRKNAAVMLHALANIEQWAIDLAWDIMARFGPSNPSLPPAFFFDFTKMALDESKHFSLLVSRLSGISPSTPYGTLPVHTSLWDSALSTSSSLLGRLAIIHLVHEARGLDVNPGTIARFARAKDEESVKALEVIHQDEVTHVTTGHRWFTWLCEKEGKDAVKAFREEVRKGWRGEVRGPFNVEARAKAGMTKEFYEDLRGDLGAGEADLGKGIGGEKERLVSEEKNAGAGEAANVEVAYEKTG
ncbi:DUF455-domain-containing protein [Leucogyrophana mollusca]|uniref:DUF455-domain-containing protein n=1 Tax=Leucogyrophana mollusca TaxID=85980 RepID=A0ACB8BGN3_9AGAM|nr:DUF455-domain-containing protein [Leucogyrophana mollusca]